MQVVGLALVIILVPGFLYQRIEYAIISLPVVFVVFVRGVGLYPVRLAVLSYVVGLEDGVKVVLHPTDFVVDDGFARDGVGNRRTDRIRVVVGVLGAVVCAGKQQDKAVVVQHILHMDDIVNIGLEVCETCSLEGIVLVGIALTRVERVARECLVLVLEVERGIVDTGGHPVLACGLAVIVAVQVVVRGQPAQG